MLRHVSFMMRQCSLRDGDNERLLAFEGAFNSYKLTLRSGNHGENASRSVCVCMLMCGCVCVCLFVSLIIYLNHLRIHGMRGQEQGMH